MQPVYGDGKGTRWWSRTGRWPWWLLIAAAVGAVLMVPSLRGATGSSPGSAPAGGTAYGGTVPVAVTATGPAGGTGGTLGAGYTMTSWGPLGPVDREFLTKVRQAGLWEGPAGQLAQTRAKEARVKEVGTMLASDHHGLDTQVRQVSAQLGVPLPDQASTEQQGWVTELTGKRGDDFDRTFANRLRAAHGKVFALVGSIRAGTRNELVRQFAQTAVNVVMKHMTLLESIGKVDFGALPEPVAASAAASKANAPAAAWQPDAIRIVAVLAALGGAAAAFRVFRGIRAARRRRAPAF